MLFRTHLAFGLLAGLIALPYINPSNKIAYFIVVLISSIITDIDHEGSTINKIFPITKLFAKLFSHRGFFHTVWPPLILGFLLSRYVSAAYGYALIVGYLAHLIADSLTHQGINWFYPFFKVKIEGPIKTGTMAETVVFLLVIAAIVVFIIK